jgi:hypothetical protein
MSSSHKITLSLGLAAAAVALIFPTAARGSTNVVPNPGFEQGGCGSTPVLCGWVANPSMSQDGIDPHSGGASMHVDCGVDGCYGDPFDGSLTGAGAYSDPASCSAIGPGIHPASFWYRDVVGDQVEMDANFFPTPDCTGTPTGTSLVGSAVAGSAWQQVTGTVLAPLGTQSVLFNIAVDAVCYGSCSLQANFDDLYLDQSGDSSPPTISSFTPTSGPQGTWVAISGDHFLATSRVTIKGQPVDFIVNSPTSISARVDTDLPQGTGPITVTTPFGTTASSSSFTVTCESPGPTISSFTPTSGPVGTSVQIKGTNFTAAVNEVLFDGIAGGAFTINSPTSITATVPDLASTGPVTVETGTTGCTTSDPFTVTWPPPTISSFTPTSGPVGTAVNIYGTGFGAVTSITFNGTHDWSYSVYSPRWIMAHVPPGATTGPISVTTDKGTATSSASFTVTGPPPTIGSVTPTSAPVGTSVDIQGTNLSGATSVTFNGTAEPGFVVNSSTDITAHVPAGATTGPISVTTPSGTATSSANFTVTTPPPTVSSFTPTSGPVGTSDSIAGSGFTGASSVTFAGVAATSFTLTSDTGISAVVPTGATTGPIAVTTTYGTGTSASNFTVTTAPPKITSFSPTSGHAGEQVTITGSDFTGATSVKLGATPAKFTVNSATKITATVPTIASGSYKWSVTTPAGTATSSTYFHVSDDQG